jgi:hypothetical protein
VPGADPAFVSFAEVLHGTLARRESEPAAPAPAVVASDVPASTCVPIDDVAGAADLLRDVRIFRARLADAFDAARTALVHELAYAVLGRELQLAPADIASIAQRITVEHAATQPLRVRVAPADVAAVNARAAGLPPIVADAFLAPGDAMLEFADGHIDARLGVRLAALLHGAV